MNENKSKVNKLPSLIGLASMLLSISSIWLVVYFSVVGFIFPFIALVGGIYSVAKSGKDKFIGTIAIILASILVFFILLFILFAFTISLNFRDFH